MSWLYWIRTSCMLLPLAIMRPHILSGICGRNEVLSSIEVVAKIANALEVSLDYLAGNTDQLLEKVLQSVCLTKYKSPELGPCYHFTISVFPNNQDL